MRCLSRRLLCAAAAGPTLTAWLDKLATKAEEFDAAPRDSLASQQNKSDSAKALAALWLEVEEACGHAAAVRETDTLFSIVQCLLKKRRYPPQARMWPVLAEHLLTYSDIESTAVLSYPGLDDDTPRSEGYNSGSRPNISAADAVVAASRETLLMTGGVVPLSARTPCSDGRTIGIALTHFVANMAATTPPQNSADDTPANRRDVLSRMGSVLVAALARNAESIRWQFVAEPTWSLMDLLQADAAPLGGGLPAETSGGDGAQTSLLTSFLQQLCRDVTFGALGPRLALLYMYRRRRAAEVAESTNTEVASLHEQLDHLSLVLDAVLHTYREPLAAGARGALAPALKYMLDDMEVLFQHNINRGNPLQLSTEVQSRHRVRLSLALLRALRLETTAPEDFLQAAMGVVDRCPPTIAIEGELLAGKVRLLELDDIDDSARHAIYADLLTSLRNLVDLRPRHVSGEAAADASVVPLLARAADGAAPAFDNEGVGQEVLQRAHVLVITALCASHEDALVDEAYGVVVAHKYHGLVVTREVVHPLMAILSRRGDCRVFNLVDLCVLYSNCTVDTSIIGFLFRACAVAGDVYRARTLLQLLKEVVPGFLIKASEEIKDALRELKVLPPLPWHLFVDEEQQLEASALGQTRAAPRELPNVNTA